jgi:hypothetical protein
MQSLKALLLGLAAIGWSGTTGAEVLVTFDHPEAYTDAALYGDRGSQPRAPAIDGIRQHLQRLGARYLRPGQTLRVEVLDVDLAGRFEPLRPFAADVRIMRQVTWPAIKVRCTLEENGVPRTTVAETIIDQNYLGHAMVYTANDPLRYEKTMLDAWFRSRFVDRRSASH